MSTMLGPVALGVPGALHQVLAQNNFGDTESDGLAGPMALLLIVLLAIGTVLLVRNMNGRLRRLPDSFPAPGEASGRAGRTASGADRAAATGTGERGAGSDG